MRTEQSQQFAPLADGLNGPSPTEANGRNVRNGQFARGNRCGRGPTGYAKQAARFRAALLEAVTDVDLRRLAEKLVNRAMRGEVFALTKLFDALLGSPGGDVDPREHFAATTKTLVAAILPKLPTELHAQVITAAAAALDELE